MGAVDFKATVQASSIRYQFAEFGPRLRSRVAVYIEKFAIGLQSWTREHYLMGSPLHYRKGNLFRSINYAPVTDDGHTVSSSVGTNLIYGRVHELGGTFHIPAHSRTLTMVFGRPVDGRQINVRAHDATYPKRAFLQPALEDREDIFYGYMEDAAEEAAEEVSHGAA